MHFAHEDNIGFPEIIDHLLVGYYLSVAQPEYLRACRIAISLKMPCGNDRDENNE
jgi:hypothetical protein